MSRYNELFGTVLEEAVRVYEEHREVKGDSWQVLDIKYLRGSLNRKVAAWNEIVDLGYADGDYRGRVEYNLLIDIINLAVMIAKR